MFVFRYVSKFKGTVKEEHSSNRADHKTMGQAKVPVPTTENFLKKHSKEPILPDSKYHIQTYTLTVYLIDRLIFLRNNVNLK